MDDDDAVRTTARGVLKATGASCEVAADAKEAVAFAEDGPTPFGLIIVDLRLPGLDGPGLVQTLRRGRHRDVPIVVMSGALDRDLQQLCQSMGANSCVMKPVSADAYIQAVQDVFHYWSRVHRPLAAS